MQTRQEIIVRLYYNFNRRNIDEIMPYLHADVIWPNGFEGGYVYGPDEVRSYWTRQWTMIDPTVLPLQIGTDEQGRTVVDVHQVVRDMAGNILQDQMVQHVYTFENDQVITMEIRNP